MTIRTRAAVVSRPGGPFVFQDVELDGPRPGEALVRMVACGICHTDIAARDGLFGLDFPAVFGHEGAGIVESVGREVVRVRPGDKVVISFGSCGKCSHCKDAHPAHCKDFERLNFGCARPDGSSAIHDTRGTAVGCCFFGQSSLAFHALAGERNLVPVDAADNDELALFAPLGCGVQAGAGTVMNELKPRPGESFVVFGAGTVGLSALMAARMAGATPIVAVEQGAFSPGIGERAWSDLRTGHTAGRNCPQTQGTHRNGRSCGRDDGRPAVNRPCDKVSWPLRDDVDAGRLRRGLGRLGLTAIAGSKPDGLLQHCG